MAFNLGDALKNVSNSGTGREQITYLPISSLDADSGNFYEVRDVDALADNISVAGLQQPIRVRKGESLGRYTIVSGHRRLAACRKLAEEQPEAWREVPCIIETDAASPALQQLRLIYANANTRQLTSAELSEQAQQVEKLLYALKEEGYEFPGRMRDHVAEAVGASRTKLARLKVIREHLIPEFDDSWRSGKLSEHAAYALAQASEDRQRLIFEARGKAKTGALASIVESEISNCLREMDKGRSLCEELTCFRGCPCDHAAAREKRAAKLGMYNSLDCEGCCRECSYLAACKGSCEYAGDVKKAQLTEAKRAKVQAAEADLARNKQRDADAKERVALGAKIYQRAEARRVALGISVPELVKTWTPYSSDYYSKQYEDGVQGKNLTEHSQLFCTVTIPGAQKLIAVADKLGCSLDYLLGRDIPEPQTSRGGWRTGRPEGYAVGDYVVAWAYSESDGGRLLYDDARWAGDKWIMFGAPITDDIRICWWIEKLEGAGENGS